MFNGRRMKWRSPQICMNDNTRRIDDTTKPGLNLKGNLFLEERIEGLERKRGFSQMGNFSMTKEFLT
jgi:hypothetical protein